MQKKVDDKKPKYKLTYFNIRGRGELPRIIFAAANQPFEDKRVEFIDWPNLKPKTPHGYLPILSMEEGGNVFELDQSQTIVRFLSKRFGLHGQNEIEAAIIEADLDLCYGLFLEVERISKADPGDMKKVLENLKQPFETFVKDMESKLSKKDSKGYLELQKLTTADLALYGIVTMFKCNKLGVESKILDDHFQMVGEIEGIKEYVKNRPETLG